MVARKPKPPKVIGLKTDLPPVAAAAYVGLQVMHALKAPAWSGVVEIAGREPVTKRVQLTPEAQEAIDNHQELLPYLRTSPARTVAQCPSCMSWGFTGKQPVNSGCWFSLGCAGRPVRTPLR